jgi:hypothetical protein
MAIQQNFPNIKPTLLLDFANVEQLDPRITFARASEGRFYGTQVAKAEENLLLQSQDFTTTWLNVGTTDTANTSVAPDGTTTADTITEDSANSAHLLNQTPVLGAGVYTMSVFAKPGAGSRFFTIGFSRAASAYVSATFDLSIGTNTQTRIATYTGASATITAAAQGFYLCTVTATVDSISDARVGLASVGNHAAISRGFDSYTGDNTSSLILWGAQLEQRSTVTAYTPTTTQPITNYIPVLQTAPANTARFDHNPVTGESLGLLIEEQRTNLLTYSAEFDNAAWAKTRASIVANTIVAPDGTLTGDKLVEDTTSANNHFVSQAISWISGTSYTYTVYLKKAERTWAALRFPSAVFTSNLNAYFDLDNGVVGSVTSPATSSIQNVGNGWYRCSITASATTTTSGSLILFIGQADNAIVFTGDGYSGIYIWGAQLEAGAFPTSYIPTVDSQVTRSADAASMTGANFSSWYRADEGTAQCIFSRFGTTLTPYPLGFSGGASPTTAPRISLRTDTSMNIQTQGIDAAGVGWSSANLAGSPGFNAVANAVMAWSFATRSAAGCVNGNAVTSTNAAAAAKMPVTSTLFIGNIGSLNGHIRKVAFYPIRCTNAELQGLTS